MLKRIIEAFKWFATCVAIAAVTATVAKGLVQEVSSADTTSLVVGSILVLFITIAGIYWAYICFDKTVRSLIGKGKDAVS